MMPRDLWFFLYPGIFLYLVVWGVQLKGYKDLIWIIFEIGILEHFGFGNFWLGVFTWWTIGKYSKIHRIKVWNNSCHQNFTQGRHSLLIDFQSCLLTVSYASCNLASFLCKVFVWVHAASLPVHLIRCEERRTSCEYSYDTELKMKQVSRKLQVLKKIISAGVDDTGF